MRSHLAAGVLTFLLLFAGPLRADVAGPSKPPAAPEATRPAPLTVDDLRALEKQVQAVVAKVRPATVGVAIGPNQGSGVLVEGGYVLTAGHVSGLPGRDVVLHLADGRTVKGKTLGHNGSIDSGLIKITEDGKWPTAELGNSAALKRGQWVVAIGHPGGFRPNRTPVVRLGRVLDAGAGFIRTDCTLVGGDSGGPLFDLDGKVVGIHSRISTAITANVHVPVDTYTATWASLVRGKAWGDRGIMELVQSPGGKVVLDKKERLAAEDPRVGPREPSAHRAYTLSMDPGSIYTLEMTSKEVDSFLRLEDSAGKQLAADDDSAGDLNARIVFRPSREGAYRIIVATEDAGRGGSFQLTVRRLDVNELLVQGKSSVFAALGVPRFAVPVLMHDPRGRGQVFVGGTLFDAAGKPAANVEVRFQWDKGNTSLKTNDQGVVRFRLADDRVKDLVLNVPPQYKALVELTDADGKLRLFRFFRDSGRARVTPPRGAVVQEVEGKLTDQDPFDKVRPQRRQKVHTFKVEAGATYTFDLESLDFNSFLRVEDSAGKPLAEDDDGAGNYNSRVVLRPVKDDTVRLVVTTSEPGQSGAYRLIIRKAGKE